MEGAWPLQEYQLGWVLPALLAFLALHAYLKMRPGTVG
jgi:hypothetical protein